MPSGVTATPSTKTGTPNFTSDFVLNATDATVGTYPMTVEATSASTEKKVYNFNLKVAASPAPTDCSGEVVGTYAGAEDCTIGNDNYSINITSSGTANKVNISNMYNEGFNVYANIDCDSKTLVIPPQTLTANNGNVTISGTGKYTAVGIKITYSITSTTTANGCTMNFARQ